MKLFVFISFLSFISLTLASQSTNCLQIKSVQNFDVPTYANNQSWYEIARTKTEVFEEDLVCVHAQYYPKSDGHLFVYNQGHFGTPDGKIFSIVGDAYAKNASEPSSLLVKFPETPWYAPYNIVYIDENYEHAIVYSCEDIIDLVNLNFAWILSRNRVEDSTTIEKLLTIADGLGLKRDLFVMIEQNGCVD